MNGVRINATCAQFEDKLTRFLMFFFAFALTQMPFVGHPVLLSAGFGAYALNARTKDGGSLQMHRIGSYSLSGDFSLSPKLELGLGYTLFFSRVIVGDMGFGPDLRLLFFPGGTLTYDQVRDDYVSLKMIKLKSYFFSVGLHQRQFLSTETAYAGFSLGIGMRWLLHEQMALFSRLEGQLLTGPNRVQLQLFDLSAGIIYFWQ
ncbi:MAG: hypothetical protein NZ480_04455 [Bdellovibrionaceae bacterium]|nr:hypothetical protein [Pseudobdellovibrionaceae bacterium]MDW8190006.1 hypothetical protein [Pseudobdellovibrionaceae bacterium]